MREIGKIGLVVPERPIIYTWVIIQFHSSLTSQYEWPDKDLVKTFFPRTFDPPFVTNFRLSLPPPHYPPSKSPSLPLSLSLSLPPSLSPSLSLSRSFLWSHLTNIRSKISPALQRGCVPGGCKNILKWFTVWHAKLNIIFKWEGWWWIFLYKMLELIL